MYKHRCEPNLGSKQHIFIQLLLGFQAAVLARLGRAFIVQAQETCFYRGRNRSMCGRNCCASVISRRFGDLQRDKFLLGGNLSGNWITGPPPLQFGANAPHLMGLRPLCNQDLCWQSLLFG